MFRINAVIKFILYFILFFILFRLVRSLLKRFLGANRETKIYNRPPNSKSKFDDVEDAKYIEIKPEDEKK